MVKEWYMTPNEWAIFNADEKLFQYIAENRAYCKCGHSIVFSPTTERKLCNNCKRWVYRDPEKQKEYDEKVKEEKEMLKAYRFRKEMKKRL